MPNTGFNSGEVQFDSRLFNSSKGLDTGFGEEDAYSVYDKPWRETESVANAIYRPSKNIDKDYGDEFEKALSTKRFMPDKGFEGADKSSAGTRDGPVAFEQHHTSGANFDPFQIDDFLGNLKSGGGSGGGGGSGSASAAAHGSSSSSSKREQEDDSHKRMSDSSKKKRK